MGNTGSETVSAQGYIFTLPDIGEGVAEGEILAWLAKEGDAIKEDQPLLEVMTDKVTVEIPAPRAGYLARQLVKVGDVVPVGSPLVEITATQTEGATPQPPASTPGASPTVEVPVKQEIPVVAPPVVSEVVQELPAIAVKSPATGQRVLAAPATRQKAKMLGINLCQVAGSGPHGRITPEDVDRHATTTTQNVTTSSHTSSWNVVAPPQENV